MNAIESRIADLECEIERWIAKFDERFKDIEKRLDRIEFALREMERRVNRLD
jgi:ABC-type Fe3+-hydroxamate transport system substrate-binding protein